MPLSTNTDPVTVSITEGAENIVSANGGSIAIHTPDEGGSPFLEGTVADEGRMTLRLSVNSITITPSGSGVLWNIAAAQPTGIITIEE